MDDGSLSDTQVGSVDTFDRELMLEYFPQRKNSDTESYSTLIPDQSSQLSHATLTSEMLESILSVRSDMVESIAMMSVEQSLEDKQNEVGRKRQLGDYPLCRLVYEGNSSNLYCLDDPMNRCGGRTGAVAIKFLTDQFPADDLILRLENEYNVSNRLARRCKAVRAAVRLSKGTGDGPDRNGTAGLYLEWVPGVSLREWTSSQQGKSEHTKNRDTTVNESIGNTSSFFESSIRLALNVAISLAEIHHVGETAVNNLSADHIILDAGSDGLENASVHIIGLGSASFFEGGEPLKKELSIRNDLRSLGEVFFELFTGEKPFLDDVNNHTDIAQGLIDEQRANLIHERSSSRYHMPLRELKSILTSASVPSRITVLILDLMDAVGLKTVENSDTTFSYQNCYQSASEIVNELYEMCTDLHSTLADSSVGCLQFTPGKLYGRDRQRVELINAFKRVASHGKELVLVSGFSGVGKTALVKEVFQECPETSRHFLQVKFDQQHQGEPFAAIITTFSDFCNNLVDGNADKERDVKYYFQAKVGMELLGVLTSIIPALGKIVGAEASDYRIKAWGLMAKNQFMFALRQFVKAIALPECPLVMFLDDIQWADPASLELVHALAVDPEIKSFLVIESFRSNEITQDHPFTTHLDGIKKTTIVLTEIQVENLEIWDVIELLSSAINESPIKVKSLAGIIHRKTSGNVLLVTELIRSLHGEGLLRYFPRLKAWKWDALLIESKEIVDDAANFMAQALLSLPPETQYVLKKMSCIGCQCEESILSMIVHEKVNHNRRDADNFASLLCTLETAICKGLVEKVGSKFKFAHDQIQHAAYHSIPEKDRDLWHVEIGQVLKQCCTSETDSMLFLITNQLNQGRALLTDEDGIISLAELNYQAGEKAMSTTSFSSAASYLSVGISIMLCSHLKKHYSLCIKMHILHAKAEYCAGNFDEMKKSLDFVITNAKCLDDKLEAYFTLIVWLSTQNKIENAIDIALDVLEQLGESFPRYIDNSVLMDDYYKTKEMLERSNFTDLLTRRSVSWRQEFILKVLEKVAHFSYYSRQDLCPLLNFRIVQLSLSQGICNSSVFGFASYSALLSGRFDDVSGGSSYGQLALDMLQHLQAQHKLARAYMPLYGIVFWRKPLHSILSPQLDAYHTGMKTGDNWAALVNAAQYCVCSFQCGKDLSFIQHHIDDFESKAKQCKQDTLSKLILPLKIAIQALLGERHAFVLVDGNKIKLEDLLTSAEEKNDTREVCKVLYYQMIIAHLFGNYESAGQIADKLRSKIDVGLFGKFEVCDFAFHDGLVSLALAKKAKGKSCANLFNNAMKKLQKHAEYASYNLEHKILLLEAEYASFNGSDNDARAKYDAAADLAGRNGFIQDQALAYEKAGSYYIDKGDDSQVAHYLGKAHNCYFEWGAKGKAIHLCSCYPI